MKYGLKHRIIGAVILVSVAVIVLPIMLDGGQRPALPQTTTPIPAPPPEPELRVAEPADPGASVSSGSASQKREHWQSGLTDEKKLAVWTLQAASYKSEANAAAFRDKLRQKNIRSYTQQSGNNYFVVFAGPFADPEGANKVRTLLKKEFGVTALMVRYDPMADVRG